MLVGGNPFLHPSYWILLVIYSYLKELVPVMNQCIDRFLDNMELSAHSGTPVSLREEFSLLTLNVISKVSTCTC